MNNINPDTGEVIPRSKSPRFQLWLTFFAFSTITMFSSISVRKEEEEYTANARWAVFCTAFSFAVALVVTLMHMISSLSHYIIGTKIEGVLTLVLVAFWSTTVAVVANASSGLAVDSNKDNTIVNGNLYYFSWAGFVTSILLIVSYLRSVFGVDVYGEVKNRAARLTLWAGFLACQMVVMGSSANILDKNCNIYDENYNPDSPYCFRTKFGIVVGAIGTAIALLVVGMKMVTAIASLVVEAVLSFSLCVLNGFGVAYLTSPAGPGSAIGNLYYFSWLSWLCSFLLIASLYEDYQSIHTEESTDDSTEDKTHGEIPIEPLENEV